MILFATVDLFSATPENVKTIDEVEISLELKNESLLNAFKKIEALSPFHFMYRNEDIKDVVNLNNPGKKQSVKAHLEALLANTELTYKQIDKRILISKENRQSSTTGSETNQQASLADLQEKIVSGRVTDPAGQGIPGVNIIIKGTTTGTVSDGEGDYRISVPDGAAVLVFSSVGFITEEITVGNQNVVNISLYQDVESLSEVVVTAFGLEREKKSLTYATQDVPTQQMSQARELNVINSLQGRVAGLSINTAGAGVGSEARVVLRGNRSISGDNQPLYVIDGVPTLGNPSDLSPDMIASINVLKGPNAAALYGSAAQNGAIIIETKRGKKGETRISVNNTYMINDPSIPIEFQNVYGQGLGGVYDMRTEEAWGPRMEGQLVDHWSLDPDSPAQYAFSPNPNNKSDVFQKGYNLASNVIATMGTEKTQGIFSYTLTKAAGIVPNNELLRHNATVGINSQLSKRLRLESKISFMQQNLENQLPTGPSNYNPVMQIYKMPSNISTADAINFDYLNDGGLLRQNFWNPNTDIGANPYWTLNRNLNESKRTRAILMSALHYKLTDDLTIMARGSYDVSNTNGDVKYYNDTYTRAPKGRYDVFENENSLFNGEFLLSYAKDISSNWDFNINFGGSTRMLRSGGIYVNTLPAAGLLAENLFAISNTTEHEITHDPGLNSDLQSLYGFGQIAWKNAIFLDITGRNDWSSTLPAQNRSYFYPSVGVSAVVSDLITMPTAVSLIKLRGSWAQVGNAAQPYMLSRTARFLEGGRNGFLELSNILPNPDLRPETTESIEIGMDIRFFKNRLGLDLTAYRTNTIDQLFTIGLPIGSGAASYYTNGGDIENKGIEALLTVVPVVSKNLSWEMNFNFGLNRNMVLEISDERPKLVVGSDGYLRDFIVEQGKPFGEIYSKNTWKRDEQGRVLVGPSGIPISADEGRRIANFNPDWMGGVYNNITFKNFNLGFLIEHRQGGTLVSMTNAILDGYGLTERTLLGREGGLVFGENIFPDEVAVVEETGEINNIATDAQTFWRSTGGRSQPYAEAFVESATNTRLRELTFGYTLPNNMLSRVGISNVRISLVGRNLLFLYRASKGLEPDYLSQGTGIISEGYQAFAPPTTRSYGINLSIDF
ncbi:TonB-dependent receptor plug [Flammeovirgaceae bacterium 311]|nr:TonB-dependent receptor plug [Flammeovirgaceae bacterium 311]